ncbi:MAG TPA: hypothetical protein VLX59_14210 [Acidimicrobiales bacterium]|nr:hypothetical protein [Acidimicrobiales bacterium]
MTEQLVLLDEDRTKFRLDEQTREMGRRGVAEARRALMETLEAATERSVIAA